MEFRVILIFLAFLAIVLLVESRTNQEPVNIGFIFSLPWDVANTLRAPVAGPLSIVLAAGLALIAFAGLVFAPVWYVFGLPPRSYYLHDVPSRNSRALLTLDPTIPPNIPGMTPTTDKISYPDFAHSAFLFFPHELDRSCRLLLLCHSHGFIPLLPDLYSRVLQFFSKKLVGMGDEYGRAIRTGFEDQGACSSTYDKCPYDIVTIAKLTAYHNIPSGIRESWNIQMQPHRS